MCKKTMYVKYVMYVKFIIIVKNVKFQIVSFKLFSHTKKCKLPFTYPLVEKMFLKLNAAFMNVAMT